MRWQCAVVCVCVCVSASQVTASVKKADRHGDEAESVRYVKVAVQRLSPPAAVFFCIHVQS